MPFPMFSGGKFHKSKHEKNANYSLAVTVFYLSTFGTTDRSV